MDNKNSPYITTGSEDQKHLSRVNIFLCKQWRDGTALGVEMVTSGSQQIREEGTRRWTTGGFLKANQWHLGPPGPGLTWALQLRGKESTCQYRRRGFDSWVGKIPWRRKWQPTSIFLPGESHGQRSLVGYGAWGHKELDTTEWQMLSHFSLCAGHSSRHRRHAVTKQIL